MQLTLHEHVEFEVWIMRYLGVQAIDIIGIKKVIKTQWLAHRLTAGALVHYIASAPADR